MHKSIKVRIKSKSLKNLLTNLKDANFSTIFYVLNDDEYLKNSINTYETQLKNWKLVKQVIRN